MPLPAPRTWTDGEDPANTPSADDFNLDWRDSLDFLIGNTRPFVYLQSNISQTMVANTFVTINWQVEVVKRGGMVHAANGNSITVPYDGRYVGFCQGSVGTLSATGSRIVCLIQVNAVNAARWDQGNITTAGHELACSFTLDLVANDVVTVLIRSTLATSTNNLGLNCPRIGMWYSGDGA